MRLRARREALALEKELCTKAANTSPNFVSPLGDMYIGNNNGGTDPAEGYIDDFKIYNEVVVPTP